MKHSILLTASGQVYIAGKNTFGQLGSGVADWNEVNEEGETVASFISMAYFVPVEALRNIHIIKVAAGQHHSLFLSKDGKAYACGLNKNGQCGVSKEKSVKRNRKWDKRQAKGDESQFLCVSDPQEIPIPADEGKIVDIFAGFYDTVVITEKGSVFMMGGDMSRDGYNPPRKVFEDMDVQKVSFGYRHALMIARSIPSKATEQATALRKKQQTSASVSDTNSSRPEWF